MLPDNNYQTVWNVLDALIAHYGLDFAIARVVLERDDWANTTCVVNLINRQNFHPLGIHFWYAMGDEVLAWEPIVEGRFRRFLGGSLPEPLYPRADELEKYENGCLPEYMR
jgi:hypothetical protein